MNWTAEWIWYGLESRENDYMLARRAFVLQTRPDRCAVSISADNRYKLYVNGNFVCRGPVRSGGKYQYYDEVDLAPFLRVGKNVLAVLVHHFGFSIPRLINGRAGFILQGAVADGGTGTLSLDTHERDWKVREGSAWTSPVVRASVCLAFPEVLDLRKLPEGWNRIEFDDSNWKAPYLIGRPPVKPWEIMLSRDIPFLTEHPAHLQPAILSVRKAAALATVHTVDFDLTQPFSGDFTRACGYLLLFLRAEAERELILTYTADGKVSFFLDGEERREKDEGSSTGMKLLPLTLTGGEHRLLVKVVKESFQWTFSYTWPETPGLQFSGDGSHYSPQAADWQVISPFDGDTAHPPEQEIHLDHDYPGLNRRVRWQSIAARVNVARQLTWEEPAADLAVAKRFPLHIPACPAGECAVITLDLGREITGFPCLELESEQEGTVLDLGYNEVLEDGRVIPSQWVYNYADRVILKAGRQTYESAFWWKGFRYLQITARNTAGILKINSVTVREHHYPVGQAGSFTCSDPLLNRIWQTSAYTLLCCMNDAYVDCPSREQSLFLGDLLVESLVNFYAFGDQKLIENALRQCARYQYANGLFPGACPGYTHGMNDGYVDQSLAFIGTLWNYYRFTGQADILYELDSPIENLIEGIIKYQNPDGLIQGMPFNVFVDHAVFQPAGADPSSINTGLNMTLYQTLRDAARIAETLQKPARACRYVELGEKLKQGIQKCLWNSNDGIYMEGVRQGKPMEYGSIHTNCLAVLYDIAPPETWEAITDYIVDDSKPAAREASPYFYFFIHRMLFKMNRAGKVLENLRTRWGRFLAQGYTTWPETFNFPLDSKCHAYSCTPAIDLSGDILGIKPLEPGFTRFTLSPRLEELEWAEGKVPTPYGMIELSWHRENQPGRYKLRILVPPGTVGEMSLPADWKIDRQEAKETNLTFTAGEHQFGLELLHP